MHQLELADGSTAQRYVLGDWYSQSSYLDVSADRWQLHFNALVIRLNPEILMSFTELLQPIHQFLQCKTPDSWITEAQKPERLAVLLQDHLVCELKLLCAH